MYKFHLPTHRLTKTCLLAACCIGTRQVSPAAVIIGLGNGPGVIVSVDTNTNTVTPLFNAGTIFLDALTFNGPNQIVYTQQGAGGGQLAVFNTSTNSNSIIATLTQPGLGFIKDVTLDPGGASVSVSLAGQQGQSLDRVNLTTHQISTLVSNQDIRGLTYDASGHLFAVMNGGVSQLDPITGAVLKSSAVLPFSGSAGAQGITFDPTTGMLFATDDTNSGPQRGVYELPANLSSATLLSATVGLLGDGLASDGQGSLFITDANGIDRYNIAGGILTPGTNVSGITDLALRPSSGPPPATPEPGTMSLFGLGFIGLALVLRRRARSERPRFGGCLRN